jgi:hypothetical protein
MHKNNINSHALIMSLALKIGHWWSSDHKFGKLLYRVSSLLDAAVPKFYYKWHRGSIGT